MVAGGPGTGSRCQPVHDTALGTNGDKTEPPGPDTTGKGNEKGRGGEEKEGGHELKETNLFNGFGLLLLYCTGQFSSTKVRLTRDANRC